MQQHIQFSSQSVQNNSDDTDDSRIPFSRQTKHHNSQPLILQQSTMKEEPFQNQHLSMDRLESNLVFLDPSKSNNCSSPKFTEFSLLSDQDPTFPFIFPPHPQVLSDNENDVRNFPSSVHNTPFNTVHPSFVDTSDGDVKLSPVTNGLDVEPVPNEEFIPFQLPESCHASNEINFQSSANSNTSQFLPSSVQSMVTNQQINNHSPVRQLRTPRSARRSTPKPSTLSSAIIRVRNTNATRNVPQQTRDDTTLCGTFSRDVRHNASNMITPSSVPTPKRSNGPFATNNLKSDWRPPKQLVDAHINAKHASIAAEIESWKQKTRENLRKKDADKSDPPAKLASKREAFISRKKSEKKNELLDQQLKYTIEENLVLQHKIDLLTKLLSQQTLDPQS